MTQQSWNVSATSRPGVGVTKPIFSVPLFSTFSVIVKKALDIEYRVYIWQVSPQLSCGDTCQIWMWFRESNRYFCKIENFAYGEISERSFSNPHPSWIAFMFGRCRSSAVPTPVKNECDIQFVSSLNHFWLIYLFIRLHLLLPAMYRTWPVACV